MATRTYEKRVVGPQGLDWDLLEGFEQFCRERIPGASFSLSVDLVDSTLDAESIAEARLHPNDEVKAGSGPVNLFLTGEEAQAHACVATTEPFPTWYTFKGLSETLVLGLAEAWQKRLDRWYKPAQATPPAAAPAPITPTAPAPAVPSAAVNVDPPPPTRKPTLLRRFVSRSLVDNIAGGLVVAAVIAVAGFLAHLW